MTALDIPGYKAGTWTIDPSHTEVGFSVRHLAIAKVRGKFEKFEATIVTAENPLESTVSAKAEVASVNTNDMNRDNHLRTGDFFEAAKYPYIEFVSTGVRQAGHDFKIDGNLTIKDVTKPLTFDFEFLGFQADPYGNYKAGGTAKGKINREDWGLTYNTVLEGGGFLIGSEVTITLEIEVTLNA
ncbi:YceI family protein [Gryllotalpicola sp.]|uniref:YceI family protein n=1 Tax=Gryllotalpicola sp. TaxID=1932787 RepID=UPI002609427C|nr:YceI family protein [Gryllotalpicola sp.]